MLFKYSASKTNYFHIVRLFAGLTRPKSFDSCFGCTDNGMHSC